MSFLKIILFTILIFPLMLLLSGCFDDAILDAIKAEEDFIEPFDIVLSDNDDRRTTYFPIADTGDTYSGMAGDDASYINVPAERSFTKRLDVNSTNGDIVEDNVTGLIWTMCTSDGFNSMKTDDNCVETSEKMTWSQAVTTCDNLDYAGHDDWRLPTVSEYLSLIDMGTGTGYADKISFPDTEITLNEAYWAFTSRLTINSEAMDVADYGWIVYFGGGGYLDSQVTNYIKKLDYNEGTGETTPAEAFIRCVRGGNI